eukprot:6188588-Pleurochrysis_carterae.AAC.4
MTARVVWVSAQAAIRPLKLGAAQVQAIPVLRSRHLGCWSTLNAGVSGFPRLQPDDGGSNTPGASVAPPKINRVAYAAAAAADDDSYRHAFTPAAVPVSAVRQSDRYELECIRLHQQVDAHRLEIDALTANSADCEKKAVRALRLRDFIQQETAAAAEGEATSAEASKNHQEELKQQRAATNVKYCALLKELQEERDDSRR